MFKKTFTIFAIFILAMLWCVPSNAQITSRDVHKGKYSNQTVPKGQNIPTPYSGDLVQLYDNGPLITHPGGGFGGADASALQTGLGMGTYGFGNQVSAGNTIADDVVINDEVWTIDGLTFYTYQTGSTTTSTINDARVRIWKNRPDGGGTVVWGDLTTNVLTSTSFTGIYRVLDTDLLASNRPIMAVNVTISPTLVLQPGEYWIEWEMGGTLTSGPWQPPVTIVGSTTTGNALNSAYSPLVDVGPQGAPFKVFGTSVAALGPGLATNPSPANGEIGVTTPNNTISWTNPAGATDNNVYFGTDPGSMTLISGSGLETSLPVTGLAYSTQYFWRVDEIDGTGTTTGILWNFTTEQEPCPVYELPISADFEDGLFPPNCWSQSTAAVWTNAQVVGGVNNISAVGDFYDAPPGSFDDLISMEYNSTTSPNPQLKFDWAYADYSGAELDELDIYYSVDGGTTWVILAAMYNGAAGENNLNPYGISYSAGYYFPADNEWSTRTLSLPPNTTNVSFTAISDYGNLLWLDNIHITGTLFEDSFENPPYNYPGQVACQNSAWTTWSGAPCGNEDATISQNYAHTGTQSALIDFVSPRDVDLVYLTGTKTSGKWYMNFWLYIPTGGAGYFNAQATFTVDWGFECYFNAGGSGVLDNGSNVPFIWQENTWHQCLFVLDLNTSTAEFWFGQNVMTQIATWDWTRGGSIPNTLDGFDFFGATTADQMHMDDFRFSDSAPPILQPANDVGTTSIDIVSQVAPGTLAPQATVKNFGTDTNTFDVLMTINPGGYSNSQTVTALAGGATQQVTFGNWTATTGAYTVTVTTQLTGDEDPSNDSKTQPLYVWDSNGTWSTGANYPQAMYLGGGQGYSNGSTNYLFSIAGITGSGLETECYKYDFGTNTWSPIASLPADRDRHATALSGDFLYQIGGYNIGDVIQSTAYKYDIIGNSWSAIAPLPIAIGWGKAVAYGNYIYHAGGYDGANVLADVYVYDITANTWSAATSMPDGRFGGAFSIVGNQLVYVGGAAGGIENSVFVGTITAPGVISWVTADNPFPGTQQITYGTNSDLTGRLLNSTSKTKASLSDAIPYPAGSMYRFDGAPWGSDGIIVAGGSPSSTWVAADPNPCYIYKPATDEWIAKEDVPYPHTAATMGSVFDGSTWKLLITSGIDQDGFLVDTTQIFTQTLGGGTTTSYSVNVANGWNMVSVAGTNPAGMTPVDWWPGLTGNVYKYAGGYTPITTTATGEGYWMKHTGPTVYDYTGIQIVPHNDVPINTGWNLLGLYENSVPTNTLQTSPSGMIILPVYAYSGGYVQAATMDPGVGYWVKSSGDGVITSLAPPPQSKSGEIVEYFKEDWGRIILIDATGVSYTLYAVQGEVDLNQYELPPAPPEGMFDIRYGSGRIAESLNSGSQTIEMSGVSYPVTVSVENMTVTLQDVSGKGINSELKPGESLVINNSTINKLVVLSGELAVPTEYALEQNYPNPFNPSTTIKFSLPEATNVRLVIYNALGQKVGELVNSKLETGRYSYRWDASNAASGMYIYELRTDNFVSVKKMLLLK